MILAIDGSYRDDGVTDQTVAVLKSALEAQNQAVEVVMLRDYPIEFCLNCRACMQEPGETPGTCVHEDGMQALVEKIERADAYILASPTNFGSVTAVFKRFMERLAVYGYWPGGQVAPTYRKAKVAPKKALLVSSCAAPGLLGRLVYNTRKQLALTAKTIGARPVATIFTGPAGGNDAPLTARQARKIHSKAELLLP